jgi:hypothetical protein
MVYRENIILFNLSLFTGIPARLKFYFKKLNFSPKKVAGIVLLSQV